MLGFAIFAEEGRNDVPSLGYAAVYPTATLAKLLLVQVLVALG